MNFSFRCISCSLVILLTGFSFVAPQALAAQGQQVTPSELRAAVKQSAAARQSNLNQVRSFFAEPTVAKILKDAHLDSVRIEKAMSTLDASELSKLAARTVQVQSDFAAGALSNQELTYIVIAIAAAVIVLVLV
jgi:hypothetical protein